MQQRVEVRDDRAASLAGNPLPAQGDALLVSTRSRLSHFRTEWLAPIWAVIERASTAAARWVAQSPVGRYLGARVSRRIFFTNALGLLVLLGGLLYLSMNVSWLIKARHDSLRTQGEIIAAALAANVVKDRNGLAFDPDTLPDMDGPRVPVRDEFAALELSLRPDQVTPVLRHLIRPTTIRARIYSTTGKLLVDSATLLERGHVARPDTPDEERRPRLRSLWTRITAFLAGTELPVYREIDSGNGTAYAEVRMALRGTPTAMLLLNERSEKIVSLAVPIQRVNTTLGVLLLSTRPGEIDEIVAAEQAAILSVASIAFLATLIASFLLGRTIAGPVSRLSAAANRVSQSIRAREELPDLSNRRDEIGQLATAFGEMTSSLYRRIEASEKFAADVAHELKNPVAAARSIAESFHYARTDEAREAAVREMQGELKRLNRLITDVANASRLEAELALQETAPIDVRDFLGDIVRSFNARICDSEQSVALQISPALAGPLAYVVNGNEERLGRVVINLVENALSFSPPGGVVTVRTRPTSDGAVEIIIEDEGPGIPEDRLEKIFDRFYSDRPQSDGTLGKNSGLGLSISREIVQAHSGTIRAENRWLKDGGASVRGSAVKPVGARFVVRLPMHAARTWTLPQGRRTA